MRTGQLRHIIDIQSKQATQDEWGGDIFDWANYAAGMRADVHPLSGRELMAAQAAQSEATTRFETRFIPGVTQAMRVVYGGKYYNILSVINVDELNREMHLITTTGTNEG